VIRTWQAVSAGRAAEKDHDNGGKPSNDDDPDDHLVSGHIHSSTSFSVTISAYFTNVIFS
jgi:hypothetical protein